MTQTQETALQVLQTNDVDNKKQTTGRKLGAKNTFVTAFIYKGKWRYFTSKK